MVLNWKSANREPGCGAAGIFRIVEADKAKEVLEGKRASELLKGRLAMSDEIDEILNVLNVGLIWNKTRSVGNKEKNK
jgi:hypothetical protein